jgi:mono/diheme cytochrome c family protein
MNGKSSFRERVRAIGVYCALLAGGAGAFVVLNEPVEAAWFFQIFRGCHGDGPAPGSELGEQGAWYWMRSPEQEKRVIIGHYNRYCIRCHGVDGRGVWDIPDVPDFTNSRWQASRSDAQLARATLEGRGACMPAFRGVLTLEETWAMARYLRTLVPGSEVSRPEKTPEKAPVLIEEGPAFVPPAPKALPKNPSSSLVPRRGYIVELPVTSTSP